MALQHLKHLGETLAIVLKTASKKAKNGCFLTTKSAIERARRLEVAQNLFL